MMKRFAIYIREICLGEKLPVWATLLGIVIGAVLTAASTFWIVPRLNQALERQKIRTEFIIRNLDDLNARTRSLVVDISEIHSVTLRTNTVDETAVQKIVGKIAEMQWKAIELAIIFNDAQGSRAIKDYQQSLDGVRMAVLGLQSKAELAASQEAIKRFSSSTLRVVAALANLGGLRVNNDISLPTP
jgi:hypothetical protein